MRSRNETPDRDERRGRRPALLVAFAILLVATIAIAVLFWATAGNWVGTDTTSPQGSPPGSGSPTAEPARPAP